MFNRILKLPLDGPHSIFLFGPRGTGKTSYIKTHLQGELYLDLLEFSLYSSLAADPGRLERYIPPGYTGWVVLDEVQHIPELLNEVHRLIEHKKIRFLLTGSSHGLCRGGTNLLAGRALTYTMHPLIIQEIGTELFHLDQVVQFGLLPSVVDHPDPKKYLQSYVQTYVREEVLQEGLTRNIGSFSRFLEVASFSQGQVVNFSEIARELSVTRSMVTNYFNILEDLLISNPIAPFLRCLINGPLFKNILIKTFILNISMW